MTREEFLIKLVNDGVFDIHDVLTHLEDPDMLKAVLEKVTDDMPLDNLSKSDIGKIFKYANKDIIVKVAPEYPVHRLLSIGFIAYRRIIEVKDDMDVLVPIIVDLYNHYTSKNLCEALSTFSNVRLGEYKVLDYILTENNYDALKAFIQAEDIFDFLNNTPEEFLTKMLLEYSLVLVRDINQCKTELSDSRIELLKKLANDDRGWYMYMIKYNITLLHYDWVELSDSEVQDFIRFRPDFVLENLPDKYKTKDIINLAVSCNNYIHKPFFLSIPNELLDQHIVNECWERVFGDWMFTVILDLPQYITPDIAIDCIRKNADDFLYKLPMSVLLDKKVLPEVMHSISTESKIVMVTELLPKEMLTEEMVENIIIANIDRNE